MVLRQFKDVANLILLLAAGLSLALAVREGHGYVEPVVILAVIAMNVILAVTQERGAERALEALRDLNSPTCLVLRDGARTEVDTSAVVPGDVVLLKTGDLVPADRAPHRGDRPCGGRVLAHPASPSRRRRTRTSSPRRDAPVGDRREHGLLGLSCHGGQRARAVVTATGMQTEMGRIASFLNDAQKIQTPLQRRLARVVHGVSAVAVLAAVALLATGPSAGARSSGP